MKFRNVLIADEHSIVRYGLILLVKEIVPEAACYEAGTLSEAKAVLSENKVGLLILDIDISDGGNIKMVEDIKLRWPKTPILIFSANSELHYALRYVQAGASGYIQKDSDLNELRRAIETVLAGKHYISDSAKDYAIQCMLVKENVNPGVDSLSNRELDVAKHLLKGMGIIDIAAALNLQMSTVSTYKKRIYEKLDVKNLIELSERFNTIGVE